MKGKSWRRLRLYPTESQEETLDKYISETNRIRQVTLGADKRLLLDIADNVSDVLPVGLVRTAILRGGRKPSDVVTLGTSGAESWELADVQTSAHRGTPRTSRLYIVGLGFVRYRGKVEDPFLLHLGKENDGNWYAYALERRTPEVKKRRGSIGIDMGVQTLVTLSNGIKLSPHREAERLHRRLHNLKQKERAQVEGSARHAETLHEIETTKARIMSAQVSHAHRIADFLTTHYSVIGIEQASASDTQGKINAGWSEFLEILGRKAKDRKVAVVPVHPGGTSYQCSQCGARMPKRGLSDREFVCSCCTYSEDRDVNAARNVKARALKRLNR